MMSSFQENDAEVKRAISQNGSGEDRLSDLPDCILLHILGFLNIKDAAHTCLLSKRWKDLWKGLSTLTLHSSDFTRFALFNKFVNELLFCGDGLVYLQNLHFESLGHVKNTLVKKVATIAFCHNVQRLTIIVKFNQDVDPCIFSIQSLTFLKIKHTSTSRPALLPKSLDLPQVSTLHLNNVAFPGSDDGTAEPFSPCKKLTTLIIEKWLLDNAKILCISNDKLSDLSIHWACYIGSCAGKEIVLFTPNLRAFAFSAAPHMKISGNNLSFLEEVNIKCHTTNSMEPALNVISWLQLLSNVKSLTLSSSILQVLSLIPNLLSTQPPYLGNLKSLTVITESESSLPLSDRVLEYLLKLSPSAEVSTKIGEVDANFWIREGYMYEWP